MRVSVSSPHPSPLYVIWSKQEEQPCLCSPFLILSSFQYFFDNFKRNLLESIHWGSWISSNALFCTSSRIKWREKRYLKTLFIGEDRYMVVHMGCTTKMEHWCYKMVSKESLSPFHGFLKLVRWVWLDALMCLLIKYTPSSSFTHSCMLSNLNINLNETHQLHIQTTLRPSI